ncbi:ABC-ATPase domain-containing protein [[Phormidium] sp. ETS-05]|uniref:ABC-ATPase domain-containing protein n=1 Tax=[Phormidium] sp. ETS-05 TaxID=222819 RepID=UPI0018EF0018|nr:ABC-ATPase domain-containing protein [[Phormidium] sp. ETS-05]
MDNDQTLYQMLLQMDGRGYKAYKDILGSYQFGFFVLKVDYVQGDPFAAPSKMRAIVDAKVAGFPPELYESPSRAVALRDYLTRQFARAAFRISNRRGTSKYDVSAPTGRRGQIQVAKLGQQVLERSSAFIDSQFVELRFTVGLPASGRTILGRQAAEMLCQDIPQIVEESLLYKNLDSEAIKNQVETVEDADWLRSQLGEKGLVAFVPDGAVLARYSGADDRPATDGLPFQSPPSLRVQFHCPNLGRISGMGIPAGVTLIVGGGYHGKSTLLRAIEMGVYNHIPGDGRELVCTKEAAVKIRAEDGRSVTGVDISPFINMLPQAKAQADFSTRKFTTTNASGSTSQAANIIEALEAGAKVLLVDEDTSATNFMIRDRRMQALIAKDQEPITPFIDKVRQLYTDFGVSTILVMGGSGDYFEVADTVIAMDNFLPHNVTAKAAEIAATFPTGRAKEGGASFGKITQRQPLPHSLDPSRGKRDVRLKVRDVDEVAFGTEEIDLAAVEQIVSTDQLRAIAAAMVYAKQHYMNSQRPLGEILDLVIADIHSQGLDILTPFPQGDLAAFRRFELAAAINRLRTLQVA